jgi:ribosomal-protein-alanine N-acetyltransferase
MMDEIIYRIAVPADAKQIFSIDCENFKTPWTLDAVIGSIENDCVFCAVSGETVVGYIIGYAIYTELDISRLAVREDFKRRGVAVGLLHAIINRAGLETAATYETDEDNPLLSVWLEVRVNNTPAVSLYEKMGFVCKYTRKGFYDDESPPIDAAVMCLEIKKQQ